MNGTIKVKNERLVMQLPRALCPFFQASFNSFKSKILSVALPSCHTSFHYLPDCRDREENGYGVAAILHPQLEVMKAGKQLSVIVHRVSCGKATLRLRPLPFMGPSTTDSKSRLPLSVFSLCYTELR